MVAAQRGGPRQDPAPRGQPRGARGSEIADPDAGATGTEGMF